MKPFLFAFFLTCMLYASPRAQTAVQTSFESPQFSSGSIHGQNSWILSSGNATVTSAKAKAGSLSLRFQADNSALLINHKAFEGNVTGLRGEIYADFWVNPVSFITKGIAIAGYDLFGGSSKRIFVIEYTTDNKIKAYNGGSGVNVGTWVADTWTRISVKADFATEKYRVAINGVLSETEFSFRETYTPTASGTREAGIKEYHSLRINQTTDTQIASSDVYIDDLYVGTNPIPDVSFGASSTSRTISLTQPEFGTITLSPSKTVYNLNDEVTATLTVPQGYLNAGWTGSLSGTELTKTFTVTSNMTIGAEVTINTANPPAQFSIMLVQPANGSISLSPASSDGKYYKETKVTATVSYEPCYQFNGWTGDLSGTQISKVFTVTSGLTIGADITENNTPSVVRTVSSVTDFKNALNAMNPGDIIEVADGSYNMGSVKINRSGCELRPILIVAKNQGQAVINGNTTWELDGLKYVTIKGFSFKNASVGTGIKVLNCSRVRITGNSFNLTETGSCNWVYIGDTFGSTLPLRSGHNKVDHNVFDGKTHPGKFILLDGNINQQSQYDTISYNLFKNNGPRAANEKESIRIGVSTLSKSSGFTVVEYNLFQDCDGDPEIVSVKSCDNIIRFNTFQRCLGTLCLRQGFRSVAEGNHFFGEGKTAVFTVSNSDGSTSSSTIGCGGVRVYGLDHKVINNYFHGLTGSKWDAALTITNGDVTNSSTSTADHYLPENLIAAFNTFVNNESNIEIGFDNNGKYPRYPINCLIANNIVVENKTPIIKSFSTQSLAGVTFSNNIMYPTGSSSLGINATAAQIRTVDPQLIQPACTKPGDCNEDIAYHVLRLSATSPAIDAATGSFSEASVDYEGQARTGTKDIGADEFSSVPLVVSALSEKYVGPAAVPFDYSYQGVLPVSLLSFTASGKLNDVNLAWNVAHQVNLKQYDVEWSTDGKTFIRVATIPAQDQLQHYRTSHSNAVTGNNYYRLKMLDLDGKYEYSPLRVVKISSTVKVYPNPASRILTIDMSTANVPNAQVRLVNMSGNTVLQAETSSVSHSLDVQVIPSGVYQLVLQLADGTSSSNSVVIVH
ncbi:chondroitinase-B domain-containing protein [Desertivirga xinjiangensis]|uniref:chondroitinase-B domain-containing protein n=1 Tax=Desertivirga xinjiangensis TaxID=539206 RepID=UPI00210EF3C7|nr:chondroitinase-B domain-containing protein [Pedobacter xinjiangensis]